MLKGSMFILHDISTVDLFSSIIVDMDEFDSIPFKNDSIVKGTLLLPPPQALMAESDGNELLYDEIYSNHLMNPKIRMFIGTLIACLYKGINVIFYLPESDYNNTEMKFVFHIFNLYGVHPGIPTINNLEIANWYFDINYRHIWLDMIYLHSIISPYDFLIQYPLNIPISKNSMEKLLLELNPYGKNIQEMINNILDLHQKIQNKNNTKLAIELQ